MNTKQVVGSSISAMFAAQVLVDSDEKVIWHLPHGKLKSHFTSLEVDAQKIDLGMVLLEPRVREALVPLRNTPEPRGQSGLRQLDAAFAWLGNQGLHMVDIPVNNFSEKGYVNDIIISDDLSALNDLPTDLKGRIESELAIIINSMRADLIYHPRSKWLAIEAMNYPLEAYLVESLGMELAGKFFLPWLRKLGPSALNIPTPLHRSVWAPLYYPETILEFLNSGVTQLQRAIFTVPDGLSINGFLSERFNQLEQHSNLMICMCSESGCTLRTIIQNSAGMTYAFLAGDELSASDNVEGPEVSLRPPKTRELAAIDMPILTFTSQELLPDGVTFDIREESPLVRFTVRNLHRQGNISSISVEVSPNATSDINIGVDDLALKWLPNELTRAGLELRDIRQARMRVPQCSNTKFVEGETIAPLDPVRESFQFFATIGKDFSSLNDQLTMALFAVKGN